MAFLELQDVKTHFPVYKGLMVKQHSYTRTLLEAIPHIQQTA